MSCIALNNPICHQARMKGITVYNALPLSKKKKTDLELIGMFSVQQI